MSSPARPPSDPPVALPPAGRAALRAGVVGNRIDNVHVFLPLTALAPVIARLAGPAAATGTGAVIVIAMLLGRPVGGLVLGPVSGRLGRTRTTRPAIGGTASCALLIGCMPTHRVLGAGAIVLVLVLRFLGGVFVAGEYSAAIPLPTEWSAPGRRGLMRSDPVDGALSPGLGRLRRGGAAHRARPGALRGVGLACPLPPRRRLLAGHARPLPHPRRRCAAVPPAAPLVGGGRGRHRRGARRALGGRLLAGLHDDDRAVAAHRHDGAHPHHEPVDRCRAAGGEGLAGDGCGLGRPGPVDDARRAPVHPHRQAGPARRLGDRRGRARPRPVADDGLLARPRSRGRAGGPAAGGDGGGLRGPSRPICRSGSPLGCAPPATAWGTASRSSSRPSTPSTCRRRAAICGLVALEGRSSPSASCWAPPSAPDGSTTTSTPWRTRPVGRTSRERGGPHPAGPSPARQSTARAGRPVGPGTIRRPAPVRNGAGERCRASTLRGLKDVHGPRGPVPER